MREPEQARHFNEASNELRKANQIAWRVWALYGSSMNLFRFLGVLVGVGASHVLSGTAELGDVGAFLLLATFLYQPVGKLHELNRLMQEGRAAGERVFEILDSAPEAKGGQAFAGTVRGEIEFRNLSFSYTGERPALIDISFLTRGPVKRSRSSARPARENRRSSICSPVSTNSIAAKS